MMRVTIDEDGVRTGPFDTEGPIKLTFTPDTPDYSDYTPGEPAEFEVQAPPHTIRCTQDAWVTIEQVKP